jgi:bifunctional UDP-N-acetylglucosamine pyrophosphorylase / glucosamine-1-phosphate N-acetyltransferase
MVALLCYNFGDVNITNSGVAAIVLAAGRSTRMKSKLPKMLHPVCGKPVLFHLLDALASAGVERRVVVIGHEGALVQKTVEAAYVGVEFVWQTEQKGTGHAVRMAESVLADHTGPILVVPGDTPLLTGEILRELLTAHAEDEESSVTLLSAILEDAGSYGRIVRSSNDLVEAIVEAKDATTEQRQLKEINAAVYVFDGKNLFERLSQLTPNNAQGEYYLTDVVALARRAGESVRAVVASDWSVTLGVNTRVELADCSARMRPKILHALMLSGVSIIDPATTYIDASVQIGVDTTIHPGTHLRGKTKIGEDCEIGPYVVITDSIIGNQCRIGPFAQLRVNSVLGDKVKIGNFVETKNSTLGDSVSAGHLTYLGDASIGATTNIGAGTITCNYDGFAKHRTTIGADAFIGSNSILVAPVTVGDGALTAAGSVITKIVPDGALAVAREKQHNIEGWETARRAKKQAETKKNTEKEA